MKLLVSQKKKDLESKLKFWLLVSQKKKDSDKKPKKRLLELPSKKDLLKKLQQLRSKIGLELKSVLANFGFKSLFFKNSTICSFEI